MEKEDKNDFIPMDQIAYHKYISHVIDFQLPIAESHLIKRGHFYPFGGTLANEELKLTMVHEKDMRENLKMLKKLLKDQLAAKEIELGFITNNSTITSNGKKFDAVSITFDDGETAIFIAYPYKIKRKLTKREVTFLDPVASPEQNF
jgi:hypothetical protein